MEELTAMVAMKRFFERSDSVTPNGGRKVEMQELKDVPKDAREELGRLACVELGATLKSV